MPTLTSGSPIHPGMTKKMESSQVFHFPMSRYPRHKTAPRHSALQEKMTFPLETLQKMSQNPPSWDLQFDETGSGMEDYENFLAPESIDSSKDQREDTLLQGTEDVGSFGTSNFDFASGPEQEDIFGMENESVLPAPAEKKAQPNLEDFDKEFELIFADDTPDESEEKTS